MVINLLCQKCINMQPCIDVFDVVAQLLD